MASFLFPCCIYLVIAMTAAQVTCPGNTMCAAGWKPHCASCYLFVTTKVNQTTARSECASKGCHLAYINNQRENSFIASNIIDESWIGLTTANVGNDRQCNGNTACNRQNWTWQDNQDVNFTNWASSEPTGDSSCVRMQNRGSWADRGCDVEYMYVCENSSSTTTAAPISTSTASTTTPIPTTTPSTTTTSPPTPTTTTSTTTTPTTTTTTPTTTTPTTTTTTPTTTTPTTTTTTPTTTTTTPTTTTTTPTQPPSLLAPATLKETKTSSESEGTIYVIVAGCVGLIVVIGVVMIIVYIQTKRENDRAFKRQTSSGEMSLEKGCDDMDENAVDGEMTCVDTEYDDHQMPGEYLSSPNDPGSVEAVQAASDPEGAVIVYPEGEPFESAEAFESADTSLPESEQQGTNMQPTVTLQTVEGNHNVAPMEVIENRGVDAQP